MENTLTILQIIFYAVFSLAAIVFFFFMIVGAYRVIKILKTLQVIANDVRTVSDDAKQKIEDIIEKFSLLPIISFFIKKVGRNKTSRKKVDKNKA
jgi:hypothetical protein